MTETSRSWSVSWRTTRTLRRDFGDDVIAAEKFAHEKQPFASLLWFGDYVWMEGGHRSATKESRRPALVRSATA